MFNQLFSRRPFRSVNILRSSTIALMLLAIIACAMLSAEVRAQNFQNTENTADSSLRSGLQVDPSTLGLSLQIPLRSYPGRGPNLPVTISYASKQWRIEMLRGFPTFNGYYTQSTAKYAEHSVSGWTSSLDIPTVEYFGVSQQFDPSDGKPLCTVCDPPPGVTPYFVDRMVVHMPDGSTHELRKNDTPVASASWSGIYYAVDGSRLKYDAGSTILYLPVSYRTKA